MYRKRVVLGNDAVLYNDGLARLRRCLEAVAVFGEMVNQLPSVRAWKLGVNVERRWRRAVLLRWRRFFSDRADLGVAPEFFDTSYSGTFREELRFLWEGRHEEYSAPILKFSYPPCNAYSFTQEPLNVAFQNTFAGVAASVSVGTTLDRGGRFTWLAATQTATDVVRGSSGGGTGVHSVNLFFSRSMTAPY